MGSQESPVVRMERCQQSSTVQEANDRKMQMRCPNSFKVITLATYSIQSLSRSSRRYQVSIGRITLTLGLLVFISTVCSGKATNTRDFGGCMYAHYMVNETCFRCPENCTICVSDTNCTLCRKGFYGPVCENMCDFNCTGTCHMEYGHCTYGCPDGIYPAGDNSCQSCSNMCLLCASKSHCIDCRKSHFLDAGQCKPDHSMKRTRSEPVLVVVIITVIVIFIVIAVLVLVLYKRRSVIKKDKSKDTELSSLENVEHTIPLFTKDTDISSVEAECLAEKDELFPKSTSEHDDSDNSDLDPNAEYISQSESDISGLNLENMSETPWTVQEPEPETSEIHKPHDDGSSYLNTGTMPSEFGAQLKPYDTQQLLLTETFSGIATSPNMSYQDSSQLAITHTSTKNEEHEPFNVVPIEDLTSKLAHQIIDEQFKKYM